ncbi:hypothetical protein K438DRAFT_1752551 [Mycena galopus ATCC 62051]|nr:hypothetical protein K438DRAFT_1752551 [Mycena galopus ATCC 62051]
MYLRVGRQILASAMDGFNCGSFIDKACYVCHSLSAHHTKYPPQQSNANSNGSVVDWFLNFHTLVNVFEADWKERKGKDGIVLAPEERKGFENNIYGNAGIQASSDGSMVDRPDAFICPRYMAGRCLSVVWWTSVHMSTAWVQAPMDRRGFDSRLERGLAMVCFLAAHAYGSLQMGGKHGSVVASEESKEGKCGLEIREAIVYPIVHLHENLKLQWTWVRLPLGACVGRTLIFLARARFTVGSGSMRWKERKGKEECRCVRGKEIIREVYPLTSTPPLNPKFQWVSGRPA